MLLDLYVAKKLSKQHYNVVVLNYKLSRFADFFQL
jgi:hypothetical protein